MAVPGSGAITMLGLARERLYGSYGSVAIPPAPITLFDLVNGGGANGFPALNTCGVTPNYSMASWYSYDQTASCGCNLGDCCQFAVGYDPVDSFSACNNWMMGNTEIHKLSVDTANYLPPWQNGSQIYAGDNPECEEPSPAGYYAMTNDALGFVQYSYWNGGNWSKAFSCQF